MSDLSSYFLKFLLGLRLNPVDELPTKTIAQLSTPSFFPSEILVSIKVA